MEKFEFFPIKCRTQRAANVYQKFCTDSILQSRSAIGSQSDIRPKTLRMKVRSWHYLIDKAEVSTLVILSVILTYCIESGCLLLDIAGSSSLSILRCKSRTQAKTPT